MAVVADTQRAVSVLQGLQGRLIAAGDPELGEQFASMIDLLASPSFRHLLNLQQSVRELKHHIETGPPGQTVEDFAFNINGELVAPEPESDQEEEISHRISMGPQHPYAFENKMFEGDEGRIEKTEVAPVASSAPGPASEEEEEDFEDQDELMRSIPLEKANEDLEQALRELALGREVLSIELMKEGRGLGFSVVGLKSENQGELGIFVQQIQRNGVAARDGRLRESDQILAINGSLVDTTVSHKQAIGMLQKVKEKVNLIVARGGLHIPTPSKSDPSAAPHKAGLGQGVLENDLSNPGKAPEMTEDEARSPAAAMMAVGAATAHEEPLVQMNLDPDVHAAPPSGDHDSSTMLAPDIEVIDLYNQGSGLGFGIVGVRDIGIVVKTIVKGGAAEEDGRLQSGDIILRIGETDLDGMNSDQVASVLRQSGSHVQLVVARGALAVMQPSQGPPEGPHEGLSDTRAPPQGLDLVGQGPMEPEPLPVSPPPNLSELTSGIDTGELFEVELVKGSHGLGLSIAGFIKKTPDGGETSGIFVKKIAEGSAADVSGNIQVGDQIIEVDGVNVQGHDNKAAVDLLRQTGAVVILRLVRFPPEPLQEQEPTIQAHAAPLPDLTRPPSHDQEPLEEPFEVPEAHPPVSFNPFEGNSDEEGIPEESFEGELSPQEEIAVMALWQGLLGLDKDIVIAQLSKFEEGGSLGISLEGTVDIDEDGREVEPHHYIRFILPEGPVGQNGLLASGDELLEVNGLRLVGLNHEKVVGILKDLPQHVRLVCARHPDPAFPQRALMSDESLPHESSDEIRLPEISFGSSGTTEIEGEISAETAGLDMTTPMLPALDDSSSSPLDYSSQTVSSQDKDPMWCEDIQYIELVKGDRGLGFSILDYQDPDNPAASVIVIRSLVPDGVAEQDGRLIPGDRLVSVNESNLENCTLDTAVQVLKGAPTGLVRIGVAKPAAGMEGEETQIVSATPAMVQESPPPIPTTTPMLPDGGNISPLVDAVLAKEALDAALSEMEAETHPAKDGPPLEVLAEPAVVAAEVSLAHSAAPSPPEAQQPAMPPDLVSSITPPESSEPRAPPSERLAALIATPASPPCVPEATVKDIEKASPEERIPKIVPMRNTPPTGRKKSNIVLPPSLEVTIVLKKTNAGLGLTVSADKANGVVIKSIIRGGCVQQDGRLAVGDYITGVNGENMRNLSNNTARGVLRRSFLQGSDITVTYIPSSKAAGLLESGSSMSSESPEGTPPPHVPHPASMTQAASVSPVITPTPSLEEASAPPPVESQWGDVKTVTLNKEAGRTLGISIVGGRAGGDGQVVQGIFIKHVLESSPAGRTGQLKTGDRILEVNGCDLREATHDQAVAVIRNASNPMHFQIQSLTVGSPSAILEEDSSDGGGVVVSVEAKFVTAGAESDDNLDESREAEGESDGESEDEFGYTWKIVSERYRGLDGELIIIELTKGERGLGLSLAGNKDRSKTSVYVVGVNPAGAAGKDGRILIGDEILEINGIKVYGHSHQNASNIIGGLAPGCVKCVILRNKDALNHLAVPPVIYPNQTSMQTVLKKQEGLDEADHGVPTAQEPEPERPMPAPEDYPNVQTIELTKGPRGLGFAIYENQDMKGLSGIFVKDVTMGGPAAKEGHLKVGDQVLAVNDKSVIGLSKMSAISVLKDTKGAVTLTIDSSKPSPPPKRVSQHSYFPTVATPLGGGDGGVEIKATTQPDVFAGVPLKTQSSHGNFFPALDLGDDPNSVTDSNIDLQRSREPTTFFPPLESELDLSELSSSNCSLDAEPSNCDADRSSLESSEASATEQRSDPLTPPSDPLTCPVVKGQRSLIIVNRGYDTGLGVSIVGGTDMPQSTITIQAIQPDGAVAQDGRLQPGDQLLEVDGLDFGSITHEAALNVLRQTTSKVRMMVLRQDPPPSSSAPPQADDEEEEDEEDVDGMDVFTVILHQPAGQSLGLSIAGKAGALYISGLAPDSVADSNGQLARGDQIIAVNGLAVKNIPQEALATLRQNAEGDVRLKIARHKDGGGSRLSMSSFDNVVIAQPATVDQSEGSPDESRASEAREAFKHQAESFGSSTEMIPEDQQKQGTSGVKTITLDRGTDGLGFSIVGGYGSPHGDLPIYIKTVFNRGAAAVAKQLKRGDQILAVNGESLEKATHQMAVNLLKKARGQVTLTVVS